MKSVTDILKANRPSDFWNDDHQPRPSVNAGHTNLCYDSCRKFSNKCTTGKIIG